MGIGPFCTYGKHTSTFKLLMGGKDIKEKSSVNYLGVIIDCNLNWKAHVHELGVLVCCLNWAILYLWEF